MPTKAPTLKQRLAAALLFSAALAAALSQHRCHAVPAAQGALAVFAAVGAEVVVESGDAQAVYARRIVNRNGGEFLVDLRERKAVGTRPELGIAPALSGMLSSAPAKVKNGVQVADHRYEQAARGNENTFTAQHGAKGGGAGNERCDQAKLVHARVEPLVQQLEADFVCKVQQRFVMRALVMGSGVHSVSVMGEVRVKAAPGYGTAAVRAGSVLRKSQQFSWWVPSVSRLLGKDLQHTAAGTRRHFVEGLSHG